MQVNLQLLIV